MIALSSPAYWRATLALCLASFLVFANLHAVQPLLPMLAQHFQVSELAANWLYTLATLVLGLALLVLGPLSDILGRRGLLLLTLFGVAFSTLMMAWVEGYQALLIWRAVQGLFLAGVPAVAIAYMSDEFSPQAMVAAVGLYIAANSLGGIVGRLLSAYVAEMWGWPMSFAALGGMTWIVAFFVLWALPSSRGFVPVPWHLKTLLQHLYEHLKSPTLLLAFLIGGINFAIFLNQYTYITFVLHEPPYSLPTAWLGALFLTYLSGTLASVLSGRLLQRFRPEQCMRMAITLLILGSLLSLHGTLPLLTVAFLINSYGFFWCHSVLSGWVGRHAQQAKASASALYLVFYYLGASLGGLYLFPFWQQWQWSGVVLGSCLAFTLTAGMAYVLARRSCS
ncbi:MFS transporter [Nitrincola tapanii]|uniref:MFS transporter n=2 Tax=Nitrincola tapanii TaxID=1708751 RepID=A0A5A9W7G1_9GAMM|nr:MFS transporter [Nitrincola tapanii]